MATGRKWPQGIKCLVLIALAACDREVVTPRPPTVLVETSPQVRTVGGLLIGVGQLQESYNSLTRDVALALQDSNARAAVYIALHASPYPEHKLHFRTFLSEAGSTLLEKMAAVRHVAPPAVFAALDSLVDFEFYMPVKSHWSKWDGGANLLVVNDLTDDDRVLPAVFDLGGNRVPIRSEYEPPSIPTLSLVPVETDFSKPPTALAAAQNVTTDAGPGLYLLSTNISDVHEPFPSGSPEIEVHAFVRNGSGSFVDVQCAGEHQAYPFQFDQNNNTWSGLVEVVPEDGIGTNPIEISLWEDDRTACDPGSGRPPKVSQGNNNAYIAWGPRPTVTVSLVNGIKVVSFATLGVPLVLDVPDILDHDDELGEARVPSCWQSNGGTPFNLYMSDPGHPGNGQVSLDFRFGQRNPVCPMSVTISGPAFVYANTIATWTAVVANGTSPYSYQWYFDGSPVGTGQSYTGNTGWSDFELSVTVTDAVSATASYVLYVTVSTCTPPQISC